MSYRELNLDARKASKLDLKVALCHGLVALRVGPVALRVGQILHRMTIFYVLTVFMDFLSWRMFYYGK